MTEVYITDDNNIITAGNDEKRNFIIKLSNKYSGWEYRLGDLISYEKAMNRTIKLNIKPELLRKVEAVYNNSTYYDPYLRSHEPEVLVHSTLYSNWVNIQKDMMLKSWNLAVKDGSINEKIAIGELLGDPSEYKDYIMLGDMGYWNEIVVLSKQMNELCYDNNKPYSPGVRLYIDAKRLAEDGLLIRDGIHLKVRNKVNLNRYLLFYYTPDNDKNTKQWTPKTFAETADTAFINK